MTPSFKPPGFAFKVFALTLFVAVPSHALTVVPEDDLQEGRVFDSSSPRSQKMVRILCFGRDKNFCANSKEPARYFGMGFQCEWPQLFPENMTPDDQPNRKRFILPGSGLQVGAQTKGQSCSFRVSAFLPPVFTGTKDGDDLMAYIEWEFEKEPLVGLQGKVEGKKVILPYFLNSKRDGAHFKSPWSAGTPKNYQADMYALPSRVNAKTQNSWMTLIINGQVIDKIEVPLISSPVKWQIYDWRKKEKETYEIKHGTQG
jgi:hypothetical protein